MKIVCKRNKATEADLLEDKTIFFIGYRYGLILEKEYRVMGIRINKESRCLYYLIDEDGFPSWYPYMLFEITDKTVPENWSVDVYGKNSEEELFLLMGFDELCRDENFYDLLIERDSDAMSIYFQKKDELWGK